VNGLVQMLEMAGNTIQEQNRIIEAQGQEIARLNAALETAGGGFQFGENHFKPSAEGGPAGTIDDPLPTPPMTPSQVVNC